MADAPRRLYWDTSMFLCFLNKQEEEKRKIAQDILDNAQRVRLL